MRWLLVVLAACGGIAPGDYSSESWDATCEYYVRCGLVSNLADCRAYYRPVDDPNIEAAIDAGKLVYDGDAASACIDALSSLSCDSTEQTGDEFDICAEVFTGTLAQGEMCGFSDECVSNSCVKPSCTMACCIGTCGPPRTRPGVGQPCTGLCEDNAFCGNDSICHALLPAGAACDTYGDCQRGLYCMGLSQISSGTCTALAHLGEPCEFTGGCAELGAVCSTTCVKAGLSGDACSVDSECSQYYDCVGSRCVPFPTLGMACNTTCTGASWCDQTTMTCAAELANGATCTYSDQCASHYCLSNVCSDVALCI